MSSENATPSEESYEPSYLGPPEGEPPVDTLFNMDLHDEPPSYAQTTNSRHLHFSGHLGPTVDECIAHLELLDAFADLRDEMSHKDGLYGILGIDKKECDSRWEVFVCQAVDRFEAWYKTCIPETDILPNLPYVKVRSSGTVKLDLMEVQGSPPLLTLPPIDVLMVWHAYLLNPHHFLDDCIRSQRLGLWSYGLPLKEIHACMTDDTTYSPPMHVQEAFTQRTGRSWDGNDGDKILACPMCNAACQVSWCSYADAEMSHACDKCGFAVTHDGLKLMKFRNDIIELYHYDKPLARTCLSVNGIPLESQEHVYVNRLLTGGHSLDHVLKETVPSRPVKSLRHLVGKINKNRRAVAQVTGNMPPTDFQRMSERRMVSAYTETSTPFASLDLKGAVLRQGSFIQKMDELDWLHSPHLRGTMKRLLQKYSVFVQLIAKFPEEMAVPTLDVDLAWHTHQLSPRRYYIYCQKHTNSLINHDDRIVEGKLSDSFEKTCHAYEKLTGEAYSSCTCWYCETVRNASPKSRFGISKAAPTLREDLADSVHMSTHNAVYSANSHSANEEKTRRLRLRNQYVKMSKRLRKRGIEPPVMTDFPYTADPHFTVNFSMTATCVAGSCNGRVGSGACSSGSCFGWAAGGPTPKYKHPHKVVHNGKVVLPQGGSNPDGAAYTL